MARAVQSACCRTPLNRKQLNGYTCTLGSDNDQLKEFIRAFGATNWSKARLRPMSIDSLSSALVQHASAQQIKFCPPIHLPLQELQAVDLSFNLPLTPLISESGFDCLKVLHDAGSLVHGLGYLTLQRSNEPRP